VAVHDDDAVEAVVRERPEHVAHVRAQGVLGDPERPVERAVFFGDADRDGWGDDDRLVVVVFERLGGGMYSQTRAPVLKRLFVGQGVGADVTSRVVTP
jgi:hypothetical protein